jgi:ankyrin repeat protein
MRTLLLCLVLFATSAFAQGTAPDQARLAKARDDFASAIAKRDAARAAAFIKAGQLLDFNFDDLDKGRSFESPLTMAVHRDALDIARLLLDGGANVNRPDGSGRAAIHGTRSAEAVRLLVSRGADVNQADRSGRTPLVMAVEAGDTVTLDTLLANGARLDAPVKDGDLLARAIEGRKPEMFDALLARGIKPRDPPTRAMWLLIESGDTDRARALLNAGADPNARNERDWLITRALFRQRWELVGALLDAGANVKLPDPPGCGRSFPDCPSVQIAWLASAHPPTLEKLVKKGLDLNAQGADGRTALSIVIAEQPTSVRAVGSGARIAPADNAARVRNLLVASADPNRKVDGMTPLMLAVALADRHPGIAVEVLEAGGQVDFEVTVPPPQRDDPAAQPALRQGAVAPGALTKPLALVDNVQGELTGMSIGPVTWTMLAGRPDIALRLLQRDRRLAASDRHLLYFAATRGHWALFTAALALASDVNAGDRAGVTPLMVAAQAGNVSAVQGLLAAKAAVNARSASEWPPLLERSPLWLFAGHSPSRPNLVGGYTALRAAQEKNHAEVVRLLTQAGAR